MRPDGSLAYQMCPFDPAFQQYIREAIGHLASLRPAFIMIDDDFRLLTGRNGCFCPLHLAETGRRLGRSLSRTELIALLSDETVARLYDNVLLDSLLQLAGVIRDAMDRRTRLCPAAFAPATAMSATPGRLPAGWPARPAARGPDQQRPLPEPRNALVPGPDVPRGGPDRRA